jgi:tryptophan synthase beta chain
MERQKGMATKFLLPEDRIPTSWYNVAADLPTPPPPPLHPGTMQPAGPDDLAPLFPMGLIMQEMSTEPTIEIPDEVREIYRLWRPTPLLRARRWEKALGTPAKIFYKYEGASPAGSHKPNTAVAQAWYNKQEGITKLTTETGAGQWGSALALACQLMGMECLVYMVKVSYFQKPYRRSMIRVWGAEVIPSPSDTTDSGRAILASDPDSPGSLGIAISEAVEVAAKRDDTHYSLGSVLNHVCLHQTVIGQEALAQMELAGVYPDYVVGCVGGGSNFAGIAFPFVGENIKKGKKTRCIGVEPAACPTMTKGIYAYDYGDTAKLAPIVKMDTLGHDFVPPGIHAGGLRYHGMSPMVSHLHQLGLVEARSVVQTEVFDAGVSFARSEGIIPAPESSHAIAAARQLAEECKQSGDEKTILFNLSGHGHFDMASYDNYLDGKLEDYAYPEEKIKAAIKNLPRV